MASIGVSLVTGAAAYNIAGSSILAAATTAQHVLNSCDITSNGDLDTATDGTELLKVLSTSATAAATQITVDSAGRRIWLLIKMVMLISMRLMW